MANFCKNILIIYSFLVITSIISFSFNFTVNAAIKKYVYCRDESIVGLLAVLITVGGAIFAFFLALFVYCVVRLRKYAVALVFLILMFGLFILQLGAGCAAYNELKFVAVHMLFRGQMVNYSKLETIWDDVQRDLSCCGIDGPNDWLNASQVLPMSCCEHAGIKDTSICTIENAFQSGCLNNLSAYIMSYANVILITMLVLALVQIVGAFLTGRIFVKFRHSNATPLPTSDTFIMQVNMNNIEIQTLPTKR